MLIRYNITDRTSWKTNH